MRRGEILPYKNAKMTMTIYKDRTNESSIR